MSLQTSMFAPEAGWSPPKLDDLPDWSQAKRIGLDIETCDPHLKKLGPSVRRGGFIAGVSFCIEDHQPFYLPIQHLGGDNLDRDQVLRYLRDQAKAYKGTIVTANGQYDFDYLAEQGIEYYHCDWRDIQIADPLIYELHRSYSMAAIAERWNMPGKSEDKLRDAAREFGLDPKKDMWKLPARYVGEYAEQDAILPLRLLRKQERKIDELGLWEIYNLESRLQPCLLKMRRRGVKIDLDKLEQIEKWTLAEEAGALKEVYRKTGRKVAVGDVWKPDVMAAPLEAIGIVLKKTSTGKFSVDQNVLEHAGEVGELLLRARKVNKLRTTFAKSIRDHLVDGRIHCTFNQLRREKETGDEGGARYGRLSSCDPNLQQQPSPERDPEIAGEWRKIYIPDEGGEWLCADYSQQEPRWLTHYAEIMRLPGAFEAAERYRNDPSTDNHQMMTQIIHGDDVVNRDDFKLLRSDCKQIFLGLCYGMGGAKLARKLGLPTEWKKFTKRSGEEVKYEGAGPEAQEKLDTFDRGAPYVKRLANKCESRAKSKGKIITVLGRLCHFPEKESGGYDWTHKALNRLIQGSSGDQSKQAVIDLFDAGYSPQLQVHDEIDTTIYSRREAEEIGEIMKNCVPCNVPHKVDLEIGPSWGAIE